MQIFKDKIFTQSDDGPYKQTFVQKIAESGLSYQDLCSSFTARDRIER